MLTATIYLRADTLPDFHSVLDIIKKAGLPVSIEEVILHQEESRVKAPSVEEIKGMLDSWSEKQVDQFMDELRGGEEEHF